MTTIYIQRILEIEILNDSLSKKIYAIFLENKMDIQEVSHIDGVIREVNENYIHCNKLINDIMNDIHLDVSQKILLCDTLERVTKKSYIKKH